MSKILGINALAYLGGAELPQRNSWSLNISRELVEARVFQDSDAGSSWVNQIGGFRSWSGSINGYYDDADESIMTYTIDTVSKVSIHLYEKRSDLTRYWYGEVWTEVSEDAASDGVIELNVDFTGDGVLTRFAP